MIARILGCLVFLHGFQPLEVDSQPRKTEKAIFTVLTAPEPYGSLIPRLSSRPTVLYKNLLYEANNSVMRGADERYPHERTGSSIAKRWREIVVHTQKTFVLRDALFSQQDHPYRFSPFALLLPANWITAAASQSGKIQPVIAPELFDDSAWFAIPSPEHMFGSFPANEMLFNVATGRDTSITDSSSIHNARKTVVTLAMYAQRLIIRREFGVANLILEGSEIIARGDTSYFGGNIRKHHVIPIMVENPTHRELVEGKGVTILGREDITSEKVDSVQQTLYRRRLRDGDIALERYDISNPSERKRAIGVLQELIPRGSLGSTVWLWVTGKLRTDRVFEGEDATQYIDLFRQEVRAANIEESRLNIVSKPSVQLSRGKEMKKSLDDAVNRFRQLLIPVSINITSERLRQLIGSDRR